MNISFVKEHAYIPLFCVVLDVFFSKWFQVNVIIILVLNAPSIRISEAEATQNGFASTTLQHASCSDMAQTQGGTDCQEENQACGFHGGQR